LLTVKGMLSFMNFSLNTKWGFSSSNLDKGTKRYSSKSWRRH
jgi:hypothetical protein